VLLASVLSARSAALLFGFRRVAALAIRQLSCSCFARHSKKASGIAQAAERVERRTSETARVLLYCLASPQKQKKQSAESNPSASTYANKTQFPARASVAYALLAHVSGLGKSLS